MSNFRIVYSSFWTDAFIQELTPEQKYFYLYLITNEHIKLCGVYEITYRQMSYETGYTIEVIENLVQIFAEKGKIKYNRNTHELAIRNWGRYNNTSSPKIKSCIEREQKLVKDKDLLKFMGIKGYPMDTLSEAKDTLSEVDCIDRDRDIDKTETDTIQVSSSENSGLVVFDAEKQVLDNIAEFEKICMKTYKNAEDAKLGLRKFHLWLVQNDKYPISPKRIYAGFEKWLLNEKTINNGTYQKPDGTKLGTSDKRTKAIANWGRNIGQ